MGQTKQIASTDSRLTTYDTVRRRLDVTPSETNMPPPSGRRARFPALKYINTPSRTPEHGHNVLKLAFNRQENKLAEIASKTIHPVQVPYGTVFYNTGIGTVQVPERYGTVPYRIIVQ